jgi:methionyl aminopeptidase
VIELKTPEEIEKIREGGRIIGALFRELAGQVKPGVSTGAIDALGEEFIRSHEGAVPVFKGLYGFPGSLCISVNDEVVHGIPRDTRVLEAGDIVSIDVGVKLHGWCSDSARTFPVGDVSPEAARLLEVTADALDRAVDAARVGHHVGDIGAAVAQAVRGSGFSIIRDLVGHGVGREVHEEPQVPNVGRSGEGPALREGMVLAIEPMLAAGTWKIRTLADQWTMSTADGALSAHFEHTVAVTAEGPRVLTAG